MVRNRCNSTTIRRILYTYRFIKARLHIMAQTCFIRGNFVAYINSLNFQFLKTVRFLHVFHEFMELFLSKHVLYMKYALYVRKVLSCNFVNVLSLHAKSYYHKTFKKLRLKCVLTLRTAFMS